MVRSLLFTFALLLLSGAAALAQSTTALQGTVTDDAGETLIGATVKVLRGTELVRGAITDVQGQYRVQLDPGMYSVEVSYTGFAPQRVDGVQVLTGKINFVDVTMSANTVIDEVVVTAYQVALIEQDKTSGGQTLTSEQIRNLPTRSVSQIVATTAGTTRSENGDINIKGARASGTNYFLDGIRVAGTPPPVQDLEQISVITGGLGAEYGDVTGGVISLVTKGPASEYHGAVEIENSHYLDSYGWLLGTANVSGPIWKHNGRTIVGFRLSGQYWTQKDDDPPALPVYRPKESVLRRLEQHPVTLFNNTPFVTAEELTTDSMDVLDYNPYEDRRDIDLTSKLDFRLTNNIDLSITGTYKDIQNQFTPGGWQVFNSQNNPTQYNQRYRGIARFRHRLGDDSSQGSSDRGVSISNASYQIQAGFERGNGEVYDPRHEDRFFEYGYVGRFNYDFVPITGTIGQDSFGHVDYLRNFTGYQAGYVDGNGQTVIPNPGLAAYNEFASTDPNSPGALGTFLAQNGRFNNVYNTVWSSMHTNINQVYNTYSKSEEDILTLQASAGFDLKLGRSGTHNIQFGLLNEQRTNRAYNLAPFGLLQVADQLANGHIIGVDTTRIIGKYWDELISPLIGDSIDQYANRFVDQPGNRFYRSIRDKYGLDLDERVNVLGLSPNDLSLDMFAPRELLDQQLVNYYGYDYLGNRVEGNVTFNDFFSSTSTDGVRNFPVAPLRPLYQAAFLKDKFTFNKMIFSLGVRVEQFDLNTRVLKDPYSLYQIKSARDFHSDANITDVPKPANVGDDYKVYVESENNPRVVAYRKGETWYDPNGNEVNDPLLIFGGGGVVRPYLADTMRGDDIFSEDFDPNTAFEDYTPQVNWLPRLAFSFPISKEANFFAHYDILVSRPPSNWQVTPLDYLYFYVPGRTPENNANLRPERIVDYEVGFQQLLSENSALKFSAYYREMRDMLQIRNLRYVPVIGKYTTYGNIDFGTVKGFTVQYDLRRIQNTEIRLAYTLQFAEGTGSEPETQRIFQRNNIRTLYPLDFDERHNIQAIIDYRFDEGKNYNGPVIGNSEVLANFGVNMQIGAISGRPYTAAIAPTRFGSQGIQGAINGNRLPWRYNIDLRADKSFALGRRNAAGGGLNLNVYFRVSNLLNTRNVLGVYRATGSPDDDGYLATAEGASIVRGVSDIGRNANAYLSSYAWRLQNSDFFTQPRRFFVGAVVEF